MTEPIYVTFTRLRDEAGPITFGPFDHVQITYNILRVGQDGEHLAELDESGDWFLVYTDFDFPDGIEVNWSDVLIYSDNPDSPPLPIRSRNHIYDTLSKLRDATRPPGDKR